MKACYVQYNAVTYGVAVRGGAAAIAWWHGGAAARRRCWVRTALGPTKQMHHHKSTISEHDVMCCTTITALGVEENH